MAQVGFGEGNFNNDISFYRGVQDRIDRIGILSDKPEIAYAHYKEFDDKSGYFKCCSEIKADGSIGKKAVCCENLKSPVPRFAIPIVHYATKKNGDLSKPLSWEVKLWIFNSEKFGQLKTIFKSWGPLTERDLAVTCTGEQYQKLTIQPLKEAIWTAKDELKEEILGFVENIEEAVPRVIAKNIDEDGWKKRLGLISREAGEEVDLASSDVDINDLINS